MDKPVCSVIIPAYNHARFLRDCVASVQGQTLRNIEILVVDDASRDDTPAIMAELCQGDSRIRYIPLSENQGVAAARNRGVQEARAEWIALLDSDDLWLPKKLEKQLLLQQASGAELIYTAAACIAEGNSPTGRCFYVPSTVSYDSLLGGNCIVCSSVLVKKHWLLRYPMTHSRLHEDYLCWLRLLKGGILAAGVKEPLVQYRLTPGSKSRGKLKSALTTWKTWKQAGVPLIKRCYCLCRYPLHGLKRYL